MEAASKESLLTIAFIDSETLETEMIVSPLTSDRDTVPALSVYAVAQMLGSHSRTEFVNALNHHHSFECTATVNGVRLSVSLCTTGVFCGRWSHLLLIGRARNGVRPA